MSKPSELYNPNYQSVAAIAHQMMDAIFAPFDHSKGDNGYEELRLEINGDNYSIERNGNEWFWSCGYDTDNQSYASACEAQQAAIDYVEQQIRNERFEAEEAINTRYYGSYEQQKRSTYRSITGGDL